MQILTDTSNLKYGGLIVLLKILYRIFRKTIQLINLDSILDYKRVNFIFGLLSNIIIIPIGKKSSLIFLTMLYYAIRHTVNFLKDHLYLSKNRMSKEAKQVYYIGLSLGFLAVTLINPRYRETIKLIN